MALYITAGHSKQPDPWLGLPADPGAEYGPWREADLAAELRDLVCKELAALGLQPIKDDDRASWPAMLKWMKKLIRRTDMLLDIHFNALRGAPAYGTEIFIAPNASQAVHDWAGELCEAVATVIQTANRGVKYPAQSARGGLAVPHASDRAALIEICFITNSEDMRRYNLHKKDVARAIAMVIDKHY